MGFGGKCEGFGRRQTKYAKKGSKRSGGRIKVYSMKRAGSTPKRAGRCMGGVGRFSVREQAQRGYLNLGLAIIHAK